MLAAGFAALPFLPESDLSTDEWLALGLGAALLRRAPGRSVLALAREVGILRLRLGPSAALELEERGPAARASGPKRSSRFELGPQARSRSASSPPTAVMSATALEPSIESLAGDPLLARRDFEEAADAEVWRALDIPGSPYAVALGRDGTVLAKGTFNNLAQLESILATAERRGRASPQEAVGA